MLKFEKPWYRLTLLLQISHQTWFSGLFLHQAACNGNKQMWWIKYEQASIIVMHGGKWGIRESCSRKFCTLRKNLPFRSYLLGLILTKMSEKLFLKNKSNFWQTATIFRENVASFSPVVIIRVLPNYLPFLLFYAIFRIILLHKLCWILH